MSLKLSNCSCELIQTGILPYYSDFFSMTLSMVLTLFHRNAHLLYSLHRHHPHCMFLVIRVDVWDDLLPYHIVVKVSSFNDVDIPFLPHHHSCVVHHFHHYQKYLLVGRSLTHSLSALCSLLSSALSVFERQKNGNPNYVYISVS